MMRLTILSISGRPGLYKLVSKGKASLIVESIDERHRRTPAFTTDRVISLADITVYAASDDIPLMKIMAGIREKEGGKPVVLNYRKCPKEELRGYFAQVQPDFDRERVHDSDIRRILSWYDILVNNGITNFEEIMKPTDGDNIADRE